MKYHELVSEVSQPVKTTKITVEVLQVKNNAVDKFRICHTQVFGTIR
jgi:hypothetical protein